MDSISEKLLTLSSQELEELQGYLTAWYLKADTENLMKFIYDFYMMVNKIKYMKMGVENL